jgi:hypothetical protein
MKTASLIPVLLVVLALCVPSKLAAHGGKLDKNGGHNSKKFGYHYHRSPPQKSTAPKTAAKPQGGSPKSNDRFVTYAKRGEFTIRGVAFIEKGGSHVGAGCQVVLSPASESIRNFYQDRKKANYGPGRATPPITFPTEVASYIKRTTADEKGNFVFNDLPMGDYMLFCEISWLDENQRVQNGIAWNSISIRTSTNRTQQVLVSKPL